MLSNLGNFVSSFSSRSRKTVSSVLQESKLEKAEINRLLSKVSSFTSASDYVPALISPLTEIQRTPIIDLFRELELRMKTLYNISSTLSLISSSMENIFRWRNKEN